MKSGFLNFETNFRGQGKVFFSGRYCDSIKFDESLSTPRKSNFIVFIEVLSLIFLSKQLFEHFQLNDSAIN